jgi:putative ABC transport system permease protein
MVAALVLGLIAALVAALTPAWSAARMSVLMALSGRRPPASSPRRSLGIGVVLIATGIIATAIGAGLRIATTQGELNVWLLLAGAVLGTLGFGACSGWFLSRLEGPAARLPLASRIALRDTARARNRNGPIVTALLAATAATIALAAYQTSLDPGTRRGAGGSGSCSCPGSNRRCDHPGRRQRHALRLGLVRQPE